MARASSKAWFRLPRWGALALGFSALFGGDAGAATSDVSPLGSAPPQKEHGAALDEVVVRTQGDKVYVSERGGSFQELALGNTPEALYLRKLLDEAGASTGPISVPVGSIIVANGGSGVSGPTPAAASTPSKSKPASVKQSAKRANRNKRPNGS